jgi:alpha-tubulin suppressor-like RCC1 family protein
MRRALIFGLFVVTCLSTPTVSALSASTFKADLLAMDATLSAPTNICPTSGDGFITLGWDMPTDPSVTGAVIEYRVAGSLSWLPGPDVTNPSSSSAEIAGDNSVQYEYRVAFLHGDTRSAWGTNCLLSWGRNNEDQLGNGEDTNSSVPLKVTNGLLVGNEVVSLSSGFASSCALLGDGRIACWGHYEDFQYEPGYYATGDDRRYTAVSNGGDTVCGLVDDGSVDCWGELNGFAPSAPLRVEKISVSPSQACAVLNDGVVQCWGNNSRGQLGNGTTISSETPVVVDGGSMTGQLAIDVATSGVHSCALVVNGSVHCWGSNDSLQLGSSGSESRLPKKVSGGALQGATPVALSLSGGSTCVLLDNGTVACWGINGAMEMNGTSTEQGYTPTIVNPKLFAQKELVSIHNNDEQNTCTLREDGVAACWGWDASGNLGDGQLTRSKRLPVEVYGFNFDLLSVGNGHVIGRWSGAASPGNPPSIPLALRAAYSSGNSVALSWLPPIEAGANSISRYHIERSSDAGRTWGGRIVMGGSTSHSVVVPRDDYWMFRVRAITSPTIDPGPWTTSNEVLVQTESRTTKANVTATFLTADGTPLTDVQVTWKSTDGLLKSKGEFLTNSLGEIIFPVIATGPITFTLTGGSVGDSRVKLSSATLTTVVSRSGSAVVLRSPPLPSIATRSISILMPDGLPVPDTDVEIRGGLSGLMKTGLETAKRVFQTTWKYSGWSDERLTNEVGQLVVTGFEAPTIGNDVIAHFSDQYIEQLMYGSLMSSETTVVFEQMPVVRLVTDDLEVVNVGDPVQVVFEAVDGTGDPITGINLSLESTDSSDSSALRRGTLSKESKSCAPDLKGKTNRTGKVVFRLCPTATSKWRADGKNIVASKPLELNVRPMSLKVGMSRSAASFIGFAIPSETAMSVTVQKTSKSICSADGATITGLKPGMCYAMVALKPKATKKNPRPKALLTRVAIRVVR